MRLLPGFVRPYRPGDEDRIDPPPVEIAEAAFEWLDLWDRYHRYRVIGLEHVPRTGPALLVAFHSLAVTDIFLLARRIWERDRRIVRGLTDHSMFKLPVVRDLFATVGILDGRPENGLALLESGQLASCMPGGGFEWSRPSTRARELRWGDHRGYARLAIRARAPVVPTACPASDRMYLVPLDGWRLGEAVQRWLGTTRIWPIPIGLGLGPVPFPVRLTQYVAAPMLPDVPPEAADDEDAVRAFDERVREVMRGLIARRD